MAVSGTYLDSKKNPELVSSLDKANFTIDSCGVVYSNKPLDADKESMGDWQTEIKCLRAGMAHIYKTKEFSDVTFIISKRKFKAHRAIVGARSPVLAEKLLKKHSNFPAEVDLTNDGVSEDGFEKLLHFIYTDELLKGDDEDDILDTYRAAKMFQQTGMLNQCNAILEKREITLDNVCRLLQETYDIEILKIRCLAYVKNNVLSVLTSSGFLDLLEENLRELFQKGYFKHVHPMVLLKNVLRWAQNQFAQQDDFKLVRSLLLQTDEPLLGKIELQKLKGFEITEVITNYKELLTMEEAMMFFVREHNKTAPLPYWCSHEE